jgi:hypothetical protein
MQNLTPRPVLRHASASLPLPALPAERRRIVGYTSLLRVMKYFTNSSDVGRAHLPFAAKSGAEKELVETCCALCHDLGHVVAIKRPRSGWDAIVANMVQRAAPATPQDARTISSHLVAQFGN